MLISQQIMKKVYMKDYFNETDIIREDLFSFFKDSIEFITNSKKIYIQYNPGMIRSGSIVIA